MQDLDSCFGELLIYDQDCCSGDLLERLCHGELWQALVTAVEGNMIRTGETTTGYEQ